MANIIETARAEHAYNKYVNGLESVAGLVETLSGPGPFTIFIPTDDAFDQLSDDQQADLLADPGKLARRGSGSECGRTSRRFRWGRKKSIPAETRLAISLQTR